MFEIVISRFNENLDWVTSLKIPFQIYNKGGHLELPHIVLNNIGREAQTYLHHLIVKFNSLAEYTVFLQGNPHRHTRNIISIINELPGGLNNLQELSRGCWALSDKVLVDEQSEVEAFKVYPEDFHNAFFEIPRRRFRHAYGAQYVVHRSAIQNKPVEFFIHLHDSCSWIRHEPWSIERVWPSIFDADDKYKHKIKSFYS